MKEVFMDKVKLAIIFYSMGGTNFQLAKWAAEGAAEVDAEVKIFKVPELAPIEVVNSNLVWKKQLKKQVIFPSLQMKI